MTEKYFNKRMIILPCLVTVFLFFGSFTPDSIIQKKGPDYQDNMQSSKKEIMLGVLESLENGVPYERDHSWGGNNYEAIEFPGFSIPDLSDFKYDFDFSFPEFRFDEDDLEKFEFKMEEFSRRLEQKMEEMARHLDSVLKSK